MSRILDEIREQLPVSAAGTDDKITEGNYRELLRSLRFVVQILTFVSKWVRFAKVI